GGVHDRLHGQIRREQVGKEHDVGHAKVQVVAGSDVLPPSGAISRQTGATLSKSGTRKRGANLRRWKVIPTAAKASPSAPVARRWSPEAATKNLGPSSGLRFG